MSEPSADLARAIGAVRFRYLLRRTLRGLALFGLGSLVIVLLAAQGLDALRYSQAAVSLFRLLSWTSLAALFALLALPPFIAFFRWRRVSDLDVARHIESQEPSLDAALRAAIDPRKDGTSAELSARLVETVAQRLDELAVASRVERVRFRRSAGAAAAVAGALALGAFFAPVVVRQSFPYLFLPFSRSARAASPYTVAVKPGNAAVARGGDVEIAASLVGFTSSRVELATRSASGEWTRVEMNTDTAEASPVSRFMLVAVNDPVEYFVEAASVRSDVFKVEVRDSPYVKSIALEYRYPAFTGLPPRSVEAGGDIAAVIGTDVILKVTPTFAVEGGRVIVEGETPRDLAPHGDGASALTGRIRIARDAFYRIELKTRGETFVAASPDYAIEALEDLPPAVSFARPGRDTQVTPIEEVLAEVKAEDDYGVLKVELIYALNGGAEQVRSLHETRALKEVLAGHTFFLEELDLKPGDFISYYARATDSGTPAKTTTSDIYFFETRPFRRDFRQAEQSGTGDGGGGESQGSLSQQQKQIIAATFRLKRDADHAGKDPEGERRSEPRQAQDARTVALIQGRLRAEVEQLQSRMLSRGVLTEGSEMHGTAEELKLAAARMKEAEAELDARRLGEALPKEKQALSHLQRAEASFRDVQVAMGRGGGGGGGSADAPAEELADLFELELDKLKNQYETLQQGAQESKDQQIDDAMSRLQELARRQEQENERARQRSGRSSGGGSGQSRAAQRQLADEAEDLSRRLERLTRERPQNATSGLEESARRLKDAANEMRRQASESPRTGSVEGGESALDALREARRLLDRGRSERLDRDLDEARRKADELREAQGRIASELKEAKAGSNADLSSRARSARIQERKESLAREVGELESRLDRMARESRRDQKETSRELQGAANGIRDSKLKEKIRYTKALVERAATGASEPFERDIESELRALVERIGEARNAMGVSSEERKAAALDRARSLSRGLESLEERLRESGRDNGAVSSSNEPNGEPATGRGRPGSARRGEPGGGNGPGVIDQRQLSRELRQRAQDAEAFRRALEEGGVSSADARSISERIASLSPSRAMKDPLGVAELTAQIANDLKMLEFVLRREIEGKKPSLQLAGSEELPPGYRALVEEYYRSLSRKPKD